MALHLYWTTCEIHHQHWQQFANIIRRPPGDMAGMIILSISACRSDNQPVDLISGPVEYGLRSSSRMQNGLGHESRKSDFYKRCVGGGGCFSSAVNRHSAARSQR